jgi:hypothetical protein
MAETRPRPWTANEERIATIVTRIMSVLNTAVFKASGGRLGNKYYDDYQARTDRNIPVMILSPRR